MRYIKLYENFRDRDKLKENIAACLVELSDKGFEITTIIDDSYINIEISKKGGDEIEGDPAFYQGWDSFELDEIEDEIIQVSDYVSETYDIDTEYIPETRWDNILYTNIKDIPDGLDLIRFDVYFYFNKTNENYEQEPDKDWGKDGFETNEKELKKRVENIFVELVDEGYLVDVEISFMSISVSIKRDSELELMQEFSDNKFIDNEFVRDYVEIFIEYIRERNKNIHSEIGLRVRYELNQGQNAMHRKYIYDEFPGPENSQIVELEIVLGV